MIRHGLWAIILIYRILAFKERSIRLDKSGSACDAWREMWLCIRQRKSDILNFTADVAETAMRQ